MGCRYVKQEEESEEDGEMARNYFENYKNHLNPLPMDKILLGQSLKH